MATYYWLGGNNHFAVGEYRENEEYPEDFCWNVASNWLELKRLPTNSDGSGTNYRFFPATTPPGGGDLVIFKRFTASEAAQYGHGTSIPKAKCGFGGYWGDGGWINASNTGGYVRIKVDKNYGVGDSWKETQAEGSDGGPGLACASPWFLEGPSSVIGFDSDVVSQVGYNSPQNLRSDYLSNPTTFCEGVVFPAGLTGFHRGVRLNVSSFEILNDSREYGNGLSDVPDDLWGGNCRINLIDSTIQAMSVRSENTKIRMMGGTAEQVIIDAPIDRRASNGLQFYSLKNGDTAGDENGVMPSFTEYFYVGNFTGTGTPLGSGCVIKGDRGRHNGIILMNNHHSVTLDKLVVNTPYSARKYVGPGVDDYETGIWFSTNANTVDIYPQRKEEYSWTSPSGINNSINNPYFGHTGVMFKEPVDGTGCTVGRMTLHPTDPTSEPGRNIYKFGDISAPVWNNNPKWIDDVIGMNNLVFVDTGINISELNIEGGRFIVGTQFSQTQELGRNVVGDFLIEKGSVAEDSVLDATCPHNYHYRRFKVGAGVSHPSEGEGLAINPEGGRIKLPAQQLFVSDYASTGVYQLDTDSVKFNLTNSTFPTGI